MEQNNQQNEKIALSVKDAAALIGVSKSKMYEIMRRQDADFALRLGGRILISRPRLENWIDRMAEEQIGNVF